mgnify:CR=1 FL=1|jgi:phage tail-like protein
MIATEIRLLVRISGPDIEERQLEIGPQGLRVGRTRDNNLALENREISRQHMRIIWREDKYFIEDLNSSNGTWLNDVRLVPREARELRPDDIIRMGPFLMRVLRLEVATLSASPPEPALLPQPNGLAVPEKPRKREPRAEVHGLLTHSSTWLQYLPAIYADDDFTGRYLLIFESLFSPIVWMLDNFDFYLDADTMPTEWLQWVGSWFDILILPELPVEKQRLIVHQLGWLFSRRGTRAGLQRLLELYFDTAPEIIEPDDEPCHFIVKLSVKQSPLKNSREIAERLIMSQKPAFASFTLELL